MKSTNYKTVIKSANEQSIRKIMLDKQKATQTDLVRFSSLSFPTVSKIIDAMEESGEVLADGWEESTGGRRSKLYRINPEYQTVLSIFFEKEQFHYYVTNAVDSVISEHTCTLFTDGHLATLNAIITENLGRYPQTVSIVIGVPGAVKDGLVTHIPQSDELELVNVKQSFEEKYNVRVFVENDMNTAAAGRYDQYCNPKEDSLVCIRLADDGIGMGIVINGSLIKGYGGFVGEVNFLKLYQDKNYMELKDSLNDDVRLKMLENLVYNVCVFINPNEITFYTDVFESLTLDKLKETVHAYLPVPVIPKITFSPDFMKDYKKGLVSLAKQQNHLQYLL